jgi:hypothetical protein
MRNEGNTVGKFGELVTVVDLNDWALRALDEVFPKLARANFMRCYWKDGRPDPTELIAFPSTVQTDDLGILSPKHKFAKIIYVSSLGDFDRDRDYTVDADEVQLTGKLDCVVRGHVEKLTMVNWKGVEACHFADLKCDGQLVFNNCTICDGLPDFSCRVVFIKCTFAKTGATGTTVATGSTRASVRASDVEFINSMISFHQDGYRELKITGTQMPWWKIIRTLPRFETISFGLVTTDEANAISSQMRKHKRVIDNTMELKFTSTS